MSAGSPFWNEPEMADTNNGLKNQGPDDTGLSAGAAHVERRAMLLTRLSHDLRAPLNAIISFSQILIDGLAGSLNDEQRQQVDIIRKSGNNLLHVIENVTMLARTDLRNYGATPAPLKVEEVLEKLQLFLADSGQGEDVELLISTADGTPKIFTTDERKLLLALGNMIRYAFQAGGSGSVTLEVSGVAPGALPVFLGDLGTRDVGEEGYLKLQIRHHCSDAEKARLSELYLELDELDIRDNEQFRGIHLGLSLSRRAIEILGGRIWIERFGEGDLLTKAVIPSLVGAAAVEPLPGGGEPQGGGHVPDGVAVVEPVAAGPMTVLVVEDNPFNRNFIRLILDHMGFAVVEAENGEIGVRKALEIHPDLILMDMMMPVMDGFQATRTLKSAPEVAGIPVLAMTALSLEKDKRRAREAGCDDFLPMPSSRDVLEEKLRYWTTRNTDVKRDSTRGSSR
jgi:CheY-like chemotaxis protein